MTRMILDDDFEKWEVFASAGRHGLGGTSRIVFRCRTNPAVPPRAVELEMSKGEAEREVVSRPGEELRALLDRARTID